MTTVSVLRLRCYHAGLYAAGALALGWVFASAHWQVPPHALAVLAVTALLVIIGEVYPIRMWRQDRLIESTFSGTFALPLLATGPVVYAILAQLAGLLFVEIQQRKRPAQIAFNVSQYALMFVVTRWTICAVNDVPFGAYSPGSPGRLMLGVLVAAPVFFLVNLILAGLDMALSTGDPVLTLLTSVLRDELPVTPVVLGIAPVVIACMELSAWSVPLCMLPTMAIRHAASVAAEHEIAALHDPLTRLPNRIMLLIRLRQVLGQRRDPDSQVALLMLDLDHFKDINDTLGHATGDELLKLVAARLTSAVRPGDTVARLGGDEFAVIASGVSPQGASDMANRLIASLREAFWLADVSLNVEASVGIALSPQHGSDVGSLNRYADVALYTAKRDRGGHAVYDPTLDQHSVERLALMGELRDGIGRDELVVYFQPKISLRTGQICAVEALVRWQHPVHGLLPPARFIPAAENTGLIVPLTARVLNDSLTVLRSWRSHGLELSVAVNVTARHVADPHLPDQVSAALQAHGLPGSALTIEVTESCLMSDPEQTRKVLSRLRETGVGLSIDDFGTGYSSFAHLRDLPVTEIKVDRSFVASATESAANAAIVKSTIELGHNLGLEVVAEGVETDECLDVLAAMGCDVVQGYLFCRPVPADELLAWALTTGAAATATADERIAASW